MKHYTVIIHSKSHVLLNLSLTSRIKTNLIRMACEREADNDGDCLVFISHYVNKVLTAKLVYTVADIVPILYTINAENINVSDFWDTYNELTRK